MKNSQNEMIRQALEAGRTITALDALNEFGCLRLASRISDLKRMGYGITTAKILLDNGKIVAGYRKAIL